VTFAADVVYKPRQTLKGILLHGMNITGVVHRLAPPVVNTEFKIDRFDLEYYTVADGDGETTAAREADGDVGGD
jgi:hypothetical protein